MTSASSRFPAMTRPTNGMTIWPGGALYIPKSVQGDKLDAAKKLIAFAATQPGCDAFAKGQPPTGPYLTKALQAAQRRDAGRQGHPAYIESGKASPALEFLSPIKGPSLEQISIQVGTGQVSGAKGAALYDEDVKKQAQQLGLPGWG